ncbi:hypothetical protein KTE49_20615 [Burkholderia multivorans]|uniref:hypothetical protein n=1 Tax=Burkholderia multivorans TaxID=87883 RepID=UPI001C27B39F|nr:hypothetical protein [Burkholderia multivorans]MBU9532841.1 hypothetical protein [Burkholderia multivorans]
MNEPTFISDLIADALRVNARKRRPVARIYAAYFPDDRIKLGVTRDFDAVVRDLKREVVRRQLDRVTWFACSAFGDYKHLAHACRGMRSILKPCRLDRHSGWFRGDHHEFAALIAFIQLTRAQCERHAADKRGYVDVGGVCGELTGTWSATR